MTELRPFKCQGNLLSLWLRLLTCDLEKSYFLKHPFGSRKWMLLPAYSISNVNFTSKIYIPPVPVLKKPWDNQVPIRSRHVMSKKFRHFHKNIRSWIENECCCPRTINMSNVVFTSKIVFNYVYPKYMIMTFTLIPKRCPLELSPRAIRPSTWILRAIFKVTLWRHWGRQRGQKGVILHILPPYFHIWSHNETIMCTNTDFKNSRKRFIRYSTISQHIGI